MKKRFILLFTGLFLLCGCEIRNETTITINEDKTMEFRQQIKYDKELIDNLINSENLTLNEDGTVQDTEEGNNTQTEITNEERWAFLRESVNDTNTDNEETMTLRNYQLNGFEVTENEEDQYLGYIVSKTVNSIDDLIGTADYDFLNNGPSLETSKIFTKNEDIYNGIILINKGEDSDIDVYKENGLILTNTVTLNLPSEVLSSNATTVSEDGRTLTWNLNTMDNNSAIEFSFSLPDSQSEVVVPEKSNFTTIRNIILIVLGIVLAVLIVIIIKNKKNGDKISTPKEDKKNIQNNNINNNSQNINPAVMQQNQMNNPYMNQNVNGYQMPNQNNMIRPPQAVNQYPLPNQNQSYMNNMQPNTTMYPNQQMPQNVNTPMPNSNQNIPVQNMANPNNPNMANTQMYPNQQMPNQNINQGNQPNQMMPPYNQNINRK